MKPRCSHKVCGSGEKPFAPSPGAIFAVGADGGQVALIHNPVDHRACRTRAVSSWTRLYTDLSSRIRRAIFEVAWITVVWSRPPNSLPIFGSEESVSSRERYIATCLG